MYLLFTTLFLNLLRSFGDDLAKIIAAVIVSVTFKNENKSFNVRMTEINELRHEQAKISMQDDFASYTKFERKIIKLNSTIEQDKSGQNRFQQDLKTRLSWTFYGASSVLIFIIVLLYKNSAVFTVSKSESRFLLLTLSFPFCNIGEVSCFMWCICCNLAITKACNSVKNYRSCVSKQKTA